MAPNRRDALSASNPIGLRNRPQVTFQESVSMFIKSEESTPSNAPGALVPLEDGSVQLGSFRLTPTGLVVDGTADEGEWSQVGGLLCRLEGSIQWLIGDWFVYAEHNWGKTYEAVAAATNYDEKTLRNYACVARNVDLSLRKDKLTFGHHNLIAGLHEDLQSRWLGYAEMNQLSIASLRKEMGLIELLPHLRQVEWLDWALSQPILLSQTDDFKPPAPSKVVPSKEEKKAKTFVEYVQTELPNLDRMDDQGRGSVADRADWLSQYYAGVARKARGQ